LTKQTGQGPSPYCSCQAVPKHPESGTDGSVVAAMELVAGAVSPKLAAAKLVARADDWAWGRTVISSSSSVGSKFKSMFLREALALLIGVVDSFASAAPKTSSGISTFRLASLLD